MGKKISIKPTYGIPIQLQTVDTQLGDEPAASAGTDLGFSPEDLISLVLLCVR
jgi:hypothetical protein